MGRIFLDLRKIVTRPHKVLNLGLSEDGKLGPKTIAVIKTWQKSHGLVSDGLVGAKTKAAMQSEAEKD
ncbi:peptidoglycan-binding protein [Candidatus Nomurabacteria bacterium]|nr:peptidoglycan-binding protein [Candidatus Nomurabacteria bacterium]